MIDQRHAGIERNIKPRAISRDQRAVTAPHPPVDLGVLVGVHVVDRHLIEFATVDVGRDGIDHRIPAITGLQPFAGNAVLRRIGGVFSAFVERIQRAEKFGPLPWRKRRVRRLLAPRRAVAVDFEMQPLRDIDERVLVGGVQPAAADIEHDIRRGKNSLATPP